MIQIVVDTIDFHSKHNSTHQIHNNAGDPEILQPRETLRDEGGKSTGASGVTPALPTSPPSADEAPLEEAGLPQRARTSLGPLPKKKRSQ